MALVLKSKKTVEESKKSGGARTDYFKPKPNDKGVFKIFICPPKTEDTSIIQTVTVNEIFNLSGAKLAGYVSPSNFEEVDPIIKVGWSLRKKHATHKNKKVKEFWKRMVGKEKNLMYIIDPTNLEGGIQMYQTPASVAEFIRNDIEQSDGGDDMSFCHPQTGRLLVIKKTGLKLETRYACAWSKTDCNLDMDEDKLEELVSAIPDSVIGTIYKKPKTEEMEEFKEVIDKMAEKIDLSINWKSAKDSNLEVDDDADVDDEDEDEDLETEEVDEDLVEDEVEEKPKTSKVKADTKKTTTKEKPADKNEKTTAKTGGKTSNKKVVDDEEDIDLDLEDDDELDLE